LTKSRAAAVATISSCAKVVFSFSLMAVHPL
jgi:hypothetical protein